MPAPQNAILYSKLVKKLLASGGTLEKLATHTGLSKVTVQRWVSAMHKMGVVYIDGWAPGKRIKGTDQFSYRPVYRLHREPGRRADAPRPDKLTVTEKNRRYL